MLNLATLEKNAAGVRVFKFMGKHPVRVVELDDAPWFVATDLTEALGFPHAPAALRGIDEEDRRVRQMYTKAGMRPHSLLNESGVYALILRSEKPEAKVFKRWITSEVLPAIRRWGKYDAVLVERQKTLDLLLREGPREWSRTFPESFFSAMLDLYGHEYVASTGTPGFCGGFIREYIYEPMFSGLTPALKAKRKEIGAKDAALHQFLEDNARDELVRHIDRVTTLLQVSGRSPETFKQMFNARFRGTDQLLLGLKQSKRAA